MKKFIALLCMLTCIFGLTACGGTETVNEYQASKQANAEQYAVESIITLMVQSMYDENILDICDADGYTPEEWEAFLYNYYGVAVDGEAYLKGLDSFRTAYDTMGNFYQLGDVTSKVDGEEIIVYADIYGEKKNGQAEIILSNDFFTDLKSCTLNVDATFKELMTNAALNTLLGMGTVFTVLIFIMLIIQSFAFIPKIQAALAKKNENKAAPKAKEDDLAVVAAIAAAMAAEEEADDLELVAVISAAIAAYRGETTTDNFVVRSIKKAKRR